MMHNRHRPQRVVKSRSATTTDLIAASVNREHAAEPSMAAAKSNVQHLRKRVHDGIQQRLFFAMRHKLCSETHLYSSAILEKP